jgi:8-oxo-dGTP pyrophosphatase MutT (NUDIX family)
MTEVVAALIWKGDKFMICQRPAHKARGLLWEFVGGKVEPGETKEFWLGYIKGMSITKDVVDIINLLNNGC